MEQSFTTYWFAFAFFHFYLFLVFFLQSISLVAFGCSSTFLNYLFPVLLRCFLFRGLHYQTFKDTAFTPSFHTYSDLFFLYTQFRYSSCFSVYLPARNFTRNVLHYISLYYDKFFPFLHVKSSF